MTLQSRLLWGAVLVVLVSSLFVWRLGEIPFYTKGEPREALQVWEEYHHGEWVLPLRNGSELPSKPPLFHWIGGATALVFGRVDEFVVRFPSALLATISVLLVFWLGARKWGTLAGVYAGFILATNFEWMRAATTARVDMTLTACLTGAFVALDLVLNAARPSPAALSLLYVSMGLAALAKGPVGIVIPGLVAFVALAVRRDFGRLRHMHLFTGGAAAIAIASLWYVLAYFEGGEAFLRKHLWVENFGRFVAADESGAGHEHPFWYLVPGFLLNFAPWSFFVLPLGVYLYRNRRRLAVEGYAVPLVWFSVIFVFYSLSESKRTVYLLPCYPAAALLLGAWWKHLSEASEEMPLAVLRALIAAGIVMVATVMVLAGVVLAEAAGADPLSLLAPLLSPSDLENLPLVQETLESRIVIVALWIGALLPVLGLFLIAVRVRRWGLVFASIVVFVASTFSVVNGTFHPSLARKRSFKPFIELVRGLVKEDDRIYFYRAFDYGAVFYSERHIPAAPKDLAALPEDGRRAFVLTWESKWNELPATMRDRLQFLLRSDGHGPKGGDRLVLALVKNAGSLPEAPAATLDPAKELAGPDRSGPRESAPDQNG